MPWATQCIDESIQVLVFAKMLTIAIRRYWLRVLPCKNFKISKFLPNQGSGGVRWQFNEREGCGSGANGGWEAWEWRQMWVGKCWSKNQPWCLIFITIWNIDKGASFHRSIQMYYALERNSRMEKVVFLLIWECNIYYVSRLFLNCGFIFISR